MALPLPSVQSITDCASFCRTVTPFLFQLKTLPSRISEFGRDWDGLKDIYLTTNPLVTAIAFALSLATVFLVASEITGNYSQVDRFWSILPVVYNGHFALWARARGIQSHSLDTIAAVVAIWSVSILVPTALPTSTNQNPRPDLRSTTGAREATSTARRITDGRLSEQP